MRRLLGALALLTAACLLCSGVGLAALVLTTGAPPQRALGDLAARAQLALRADDLNTPASTSTDPVRFTVAPGQSPAQIASALAQNGLIRDEALFLQYVRASGLARALEAGVYFFSPSQPIPQIAQALTDSASSVIRFRTLEGWRIEEVADAVDRARLFGFTGADFLALVGPGAPVNPAFATSVGLPPGASLEGFLFPDSYQLPPQITAEGLRDTFLETFQARSAPLVAEAAAQNLTLYEVVTLASIVEREALHDDEHARIAAVYRNRLAIAMKLDADPTVQYALNGARGSWWPQITLADYTGVASPYNTYLGPGLPPGPIASPGLSAMQGVARPEALSALFFRTDCAGTGYHVYADTYAEHLANAC